MPTPFDRNEPTVPPLAEIFDKVEADARKTAGERLAREQWTEAPRARAGDRPRDEGRRDGAGVEQAARAGALKVQADATERG
jgi:hypothetical protein